MALPEGGGPHNDGLAGQGFGGYLSAVDDGLHIGDGKTPEPQTIGYAALGHFGGCGTGS